MRKFVLPPVIIILLTLSACALFASEISSPEEGKLTVYTTLRQDEVELYLNDFGIAYPNIEIEVVQLSAADLVTQMIAEREYPAADLLWGVGLSSALYLEWNDLLKPYEPIGLPRIEKRFRDTNQPPYWVGNSLALTAFCVNDDEIARLGVGKPTGWQDLLDPSYRRAIIMADPTKADTGLMAVMGIIELLGEQDGWRYLDALHPNIAFYPQDETEACQLVSEGDYAIGIAKAFDTMGNIEMVYPKEKTGWELYVSALVRKDAIAPAARTFLDWSISDPVMRLYTRKNALTAAPTGLSRPAEFPSDPERLLVDRNIPWSAANRERILAEWQRRYGDKAAR